MEIVESSANFQVSTMELHIFLIRIENERIVFAMASRWSPQAENFCRHLSAATSIFVFAEKTELN